MWPEKKAMQCLNRGEPKSSPLLSAQSTPVLQVLQWYETAVHIYQTHTLHIVISIFFRVYIYWINVPWKLSNLVLSCALILKLLYFTKLPKPLDKTQWYYRVIYWLSADPLSGCRHWHLPVKSPYRLTASLPVFGLKQANVFKGADGWISTQSEQKCFYTQLFIFLSDAVFAHVHQSWETMCVLTGTGICQTSVCKVSFLFLLYPTRPPPKKGAGGNCSKCPCVYF